MYLDFLKLHSKPFNITSDPSFLFYSKKHTETLEMLRYGIEQRVGFMEVTGEIGCGKTTLCKTLIGQLPDDIKTAYIFNSSLTEIQFLETFLGDLGLKTSKKNRYQLFNDLNLFLISQLKNNCNVVLIIDESQNLSLRLLEQIRMLTNLETDTEKLLQIILVGQPELKLKLDHKSLKQLKQRIVLRHHIGPLNSNEVASYIHHRMAVAGSKNSHDIFNAKVIEKITILSNGVPRVINVLCDKVLLCAYAKQSCDINEANVSEVAKEYAGIHT